MLRMLHATAVTALKLERRIDPFIRPAFDAVLREPLAAGAQGLLRLLRPRASRLPAHEQVLPGEAECIAAIIAEMAEYMRGHYRPGQFERAGNTKTHGVVRGRFVIEPNLPAELRHGVFATEREYPAWVRFAGPGPTSPPDIDDVGVLSFGIKLMDVVGDKLMEDERHTQDFTGISTPTFTTPDVIENAKLQGWIGRGLPLFHFLDLTGTHLLDGVMQGLWARTQTSPLETDYWSCVPYLLGDGRAMRYSLHPIGATRSKVPNLPRKPPDNYLREAMARTLGGGEARFAFAIQLQTHPDRMPIEDASIRWPERLSPSIRVATLILPQQVFDSPAQLSFATRLSYNPWHAVAAHRPLGNQNRGRRDIYLALSQLRQQMNAMPHVEPTGDERF